MNLRIPQRRRRVVLVLVVSACTVVGCGGSSGGGPSSSGPSSAGGESGFAGTALSPVRAAPPLALRNYLGDRVVLSDLRGKAVLVTFLYTHCVDVCPLITANLRIVLQRLGPQGRKVEIVAVSVDPRGDTRRSVATFLAAHHMTGRMKYLIGSPHELGPVWTAWHVAAVRDPSNNKLVTHSSVTYGVSAAGKMMVVYGASFQPAQIVHDIPALVAR